MDETSFQFERGRGVVWVCDVASSSKFLNDDSSAAALEEFIPRFHWVSRIAVRASGGEYIKWTGDGFLAWYPVPLHRELGGKAAAVFYAAWHLTTLLNVTNLDVKTDIKFRIRHGVTYEHDALITRINNGGSESIDLLGRSVVLAFRLSGVRAKFPGIVTQADLVQASRENVYAGAKFESWKPDRDELSKYFKGERMGTTRLCRSSDKRPTRRRSPESVIRNTKKVVKKALTRIEPGKEISNAEIFARAFSSELSGGPDWSKTVAKEYTRFFREDILGCLESMISLMEEAVNKGTPESQ